MIADGGTSKSGYQHHYYSCKNRRNKKRTGGDKGASHRTQENASEAQNIKKTDNRDQVKANNTPKSAENTPANNESKSEGASSVQNKKKKKYHRYHRNNKGSKQTDAKN